MNLVIPSLDEAETQDPKVTTGLSWANSEADAAYKSTATLLMIKSHSFAFLVLIFTSNSNPRMNLSKNLSKNNLFPPVKATIFR